MGEKVLVRGSDVGEILGRTTPSKGSALQRAVSRERFSFKGMREILAFYLRRLTEILLCSSDLSPSQQSSSLGDLLLEMMDSETPPPVSQSPEADDPEVSSRRISPDLPRPEVNTSAARSPEYSAPKESNRKSLGLSGTQPDTLMGLLERAAISETHRALMGTVVERISSAKSGLNEAFTSLLRGFEVRQN